MKRLYVSAILIALSSYYHSESTPINPEKYGLEWICPLEARAKFTMPKDDLPNFSKRFKESN